MLRIPPSGQNNNTGRQRSDLVYGMGPSVSEFWGSNRRGGLFFPTNKKSPFDVQAEKNKKLMESELAAKTTAAEQYKSFTGVHKDFEPYFNQYLYAHKGDKIKAANELFQNIRRIFANQGIAYSGDPLFEEKLNALKRYIESLYAQYASQSINGTGAAI